MLSHFSLQRHPSTKTSRLAPPSLPPHSSLLPLPSSFFSFSGFCLCSQYGKRPIYSFLESKDHASHRRISKTPILQMGKEFCQTEWHVCHTHGPKCVRDIHVPPQGKLYYHHAWLFWVQGHRFLQTRLSAILPGWHMALTHYHSQFDGILLSSKVKNVDLHLSKL